MESRNRRGRPPVLDATTVVPAPTNEPIKQYAPGTAERASLEAKVPGWSKEDVEAIMLKAHDICPYSNLIRYEHSVELTAA